MAVSFRRTFSSVHVIANIVFTDEHSSTTPIRQGNDNPVKVVRLDLKLHASWNQVLNFNGQNGVQIQIEYVHLRQIGGPLM